MEYKYQTYKYFGCHWTTKGYIFRVYAPNAKSVSVIGDFNHWNHSKNIMTDLGDGCFEIIIKNVMEHDNYKYLIETKDGKKLFKADPFAYFSQWDNQHNSLVCSIDEYKWRDRSWVNAREQVYDKPVNIYEVHLGSWKRTEDNQYLNYRQIAVELIPYVKKMGFTHIELMPVSEFPFDGSWGYQVSAYYSITSRFGEPYDFMYFVDFAHQNGIGVILDWVPGHFPKDDCGLYEFDGSLLYEDKEPTKQEHLRWGTRVFDYGDPWVQNFLISNASFLFDVYHIDGLRVDAVASMLYLDYDRKEWKANKYGTNYNLEAIEFLQALNTHIYGAFPYALMIAEESTNFAKVTSPVHEGGLGFGYKWNMGWMNDSLSFISSDNRLEVIDKITFSFLYAYNENYILPISHDEVVHGKKSLLSKMPGEYDDQFKNHRAYYGYMITHPGKKLSFMGNEIAQFIEWDFNKSIDWMLLKYPRHKEINKFYRDLNKFYLNHPQLWELDSDGSGFQWISGEEILIFKRLDRSGNELVIVINFTNRFYTEYNIHVENNYKEVFNSDENKYGGTGIVNSDDINRGQNINIKIPPFSFMIFEQIK